MLVSPCRSEGMRVRTFGSGLGPAFPFSLPLALFFLGGMLQAAQSHGHSHPVRFAGHGLLQQYTIPTPAQQNGDTAVFLAGLQCALLGKPVYNLLCVCVYKAYIGGAKMQVVLTCNSYCLDFGIVHLRLPRLCASLLWHGSLIGG